MNEENPLALSALNEEARRRDMTYGRLVEATTLEERNQIVDKYTKNHRARRRRRAEEEASAEPKPKRIRKKK